MNKPQKTIINKKNFIEGLTVNSRKFGKGMFEGFPVPYVARYDERQGKAIKYLDKETANGGKVTPFNILPAMVGACAIREIISHKDQTIVLFADGDKVVLKRHERDNDDPYTAILWALGYKAFGTNLPRQIKTALKYRLRKV